MHSLITKGVVRIVGVLAAAALSCSLVAPVAHAEDDATRKSVTPESSTCSNKLVKRGSSKARVSVSGYSFVDADLESAKIQTSGVRAQVTSCQGTGDHGVATSKISVRMKWVISSTGLGSCSFGFPSGVSCTVVGKQTVITKSFTCKNTSTCSKGFESNLRPKVRAGYKILFVTYEVRATAKQSGKSSVTAETDSVRWWK